MIFQSRVYNRLNRCFGGQWTLVTFFLYVYPFLPSSGRPRLLESRKNPFSHGRLGQRVEDERGGWAWESDPSRLSSKAFVEPPAGSYYVSGFTIFKFLKMKQVFFTYFR